MKSNLPLSSILIFGLAACGGSNESSSTQPTPEKKPHHFEHINVDVTPNSVFNGELSLYLGRWFPCSSSHPDYCTSEGSHTLTNDDDFYVMKIKAEDVKEKLATSVRQDVFAEGQYSLLDIMLYLGEVRDDFEIELGEFSEELKTYQFTVSFDSNRDGQFTLEGDGEENYKSANWYANFLYDPGVSKRTQGNPKEEIVYDRIDEFLVRNDMIIRVQPLSSQMTGRRHDFQKKEVERVEAAGGKVIVPEIQVNFGDGRGYVTIAKDVEVKPHNLRPDLLKDGVLTVADAVLSAIESHQVDFEFTYWPTLSTETKYESYAVTSIEGKRATGLMGWTLFTGEREGSKDFFYAGANVFPSIEDIVNEVPPFDGICSWLTEDNNGKHTRETAEICFDDWYGRFGGNIIHRPIDAYVMLNPKEGVRFRWHDGMAYKWDTTDHNIAGDGKYSIYNVNDASAPLTEEHFGWNIADCGLCHSIDNIHLNGDSPALPDSVEPYFCASCHGDNGAPKGHGEVSRCFWCHSEDKAMTNHGDASLIRYLKDIECSGELAGNKGSCSNVAQPDNPPIRDKASNYDKYDDMLQSRGNSDWKTSETFPDPYSCMTCHPN